MSESSTAKHHMNLMTVILFVACLLLVSGNTVFAEPFLMLDAMMPPGSPPPSSSEAGIFTSGPVFTLYALVNTESPDAPDPFAVGTYYLSAALIPSQPETFPDPDLGFYLLDGNPFYVVSDMEYGVPPIGLVSNPGLLPPHGVYETYYIEHEFLLGPGDENTTLYNSQDFPGGPDLLADGSLYYRAFDVDITGLASGYQIHFDLYTKGSLPIDKFAPFSHDLTATPIPASVILGMLGLGIAGLKLRKFA